VEEQEEREVNIRRGANKKNAALTSLIIYIYRRMLSKLFHNESYSHKIHRHENAIVFKNV